MAINYQSICDKLGFDPKTYTPEVSEHEDDSKPNPFSVLTDEESDFLHDYIMN